MGYLLTITRTLQWLFLRCNFYTVSRKVLRKFKVLTAYCVCNLLTALSTTYYYKLISLLFTQYCPNQTKVVLIQGNVLFMPSSKV
jgi:hypothetical protein